MKMHRQDFIALREATIAHMRDVEGRSDMRNRWDALHYSGFDLAALQRDTCRGGCGLNDAHIDTALRSIQREAREQAKIRELIHDDPFATVN